MGRHRYFYLTNLQGDVTAIITVGGTTVVAYTYDAWGNILTVTGSMADTLGKANPLRYRGYVYDEETRLYYLQSRYYDPEIGRFINADDPGYLGITGALTSYNLFAYCENNPVNNIDVAGNFALTAILSAAAGGAIAGALIGAVSHVVSCGLSGSELTVAGLMEATAIGAATGAIGAVGGAIGGSAAIIASVAVGAISGVVTAGSTEGPTRQKVMAGVTAGIVSAVGTFLGSKIPVSLDNALVSGVTSFAGGLFAGTNTEMVNVATQIVVSNAFIKTPSVKKPGKLQLNPTMLTY